MGDAAPTCVVSRRSVGERRWFEALSLCPFLVWCRSLRLCIGQYRAPGVGRAELAVALSRIRCGGRDAGP